MKLGRHSKIDGIYECRSNHLLWSVNWNWNLMQVLHKISYSFMLTSCDYISNQYLWGETIWQLTTSRFMLTVLIKSEINFMSIGQWPPLYSNNRNDLINSRWKIKYLVRSDILYRLPLEFDMARFQFASSLRLISNCIVWFADDFN